MLRFLMQWTFPVQGGADIGTPIRIAHVEQNSAGENSELLWLCISYAPCTV